MKYFIGIDGGGTNSRLLAVDLYGNVVGHVRGRTTNLESNPISTVMNNLNALIETFHQRHFTKYEDCAGLCFGTAGVDTKASLVTIEELLLQTPFTCPTKVVNDALIALYANTFGQPGMMLLAGTGSIAYGVNALGREKRVGGYGYIVGDEGSAYWVVREAIRAALHAYDGIGPDTRLISDFTRALEFSEFEEIIDFVYRRNKSDLARLSYVVAQAQEDGDQVANRIYSEALRYLAQSVDMLVKALGEEPMPLYLGGGFMMNSRYLQQGLAQRMKQDHPQLTLMEMSQPAEWGAVVLAASLTGHRLPESRLTGSLLL